jgi:uncharacterized protein (TIGR02453 family)
VRAIGGSGHHADVTFKGWPAEAFELYAGLETDNSRTYWLAHKEIYDSSVKAPFLALSEAVEKRYGPMRIFRPNRDTRFAKDKSPYKTNAAAMTESAGGSAFYVSISAEGMFVGCGMYHLAPDQLERLRAAVDDNRSGPVIQRAVDAARKQGYDVAAHDALKNAPRGYPKDHPRVELLKLKGLTLGRSFQLARWMHSAQALDRITKVWDDAKPMYRWLDKHVGPTNEAPPEPTF